ncbi:MAG: hypothetical protein ACD_34C00552G0001 [uncultured bacterium]|nr:MAG: hypothetical protein ACD_34C00552G0001 [uncultured bacterium]
MAEPVFVESTISFTGEYLVDVKYEVNGLNATANATPIVVKTANFQPSGPPTYNIPTMKDQTTVLTLETSYDLNMDSSASCARKNFIGNFSQIGTVKVPRMELITPIPRMINGYTIHFKLWVGS